MTIWPVRSTRIDSRLFRRLFNTYLASLPTSTRSLPVPQTNYPASGRGPPAPANHLPTEPQERIPMRSCARSSFAEFRTPRSRPTAAAPHGRALASALMLLRALGRSPSQARRRVHGPSGMRPTAQHRILLLPVRMERTTSDTLMRRRLRRPAGRCYRVILPHRQCAPAVRAEDVRVPIG